MRTDLQKSRLARSRHGQRMRDQLFELDVPKNFSNTDKSIHSERCFERARRARLLPRKRKSVSRDTSLVIALALI